MFRARLRRLLVVLGSCLFVYSFVWPVRLDDGSWVWGSGLLAALVAPQFLFTSAATSAGGLIVFLIALIPNLAGISVPFAYYLRFGERVWYRFFLLLAALFSFLLAGSAQSVDWIHGLPSSSIGWAASLAMLAFAFNLEPVAAPLPWSRKRAKIKERQTQSPTTTKPEIEAVSKFQFDLFVSYSSQADYQAVRRLEEFLETFHQRPLPGQVVRPVEVCTDLADFRIPQAQSRREEAEPSEQIAKIIDEHLSISRFLLVLCCPQAVRSKWVEFELETFLKNRSEEFVLLAVTGGDPRKRPEEVFPKAILNRDLHKRIYYDLRGFKWKYRFVQFRRLKGLGDELVRLAADLGGGGRAGEIAPIWFRERKKRRRLGASIGVATILTVAVLSLKLAELSLKVDSYRTDEYPRRLQAMTALSRWFSYRPEQLGEFVARDDAKSVFQLLVGDCYSDLNHELDRIGELSSHLSSVEGWSYENLGPILFALSEADRITNSSGEFFERSTRKISRVYAIDSFSKSPTWTSLGSRARVLYVSSYLETPSWAEPEPTSNRNESPDGVEAAEQPSADDDFFDDSWPEEDALEIHSEPAPIAMMEAFSRTHANDGRLPTPSELVVISESGLSTEGVSEWCLLDDPRIQGCAACVYLNGDVRVVPYTDVLESGERHHARVVSVSLPRDRRGRSLVDEVETAAEIP